MKYEIIKGYSEGRFRAITGISRETYKAMVDVVRKEYIKKHSKHNGRHRKLSVEDMVLATMEYLYEYRTFECIGASYGLTKQSMNDTIRWVEDMLVSSGLFHLPGKKALRDERGIEVIMVDTTETPIERPKKGQRYYYSGKKNDIR